MESLVHRASQGEMVDLNNNRFRTSIGWVLLRFYLTKSFLCLQSELGFKLYPLQVVRKILSCSCWGGLFRYICTNICISTTHPHTNYSGGGSDKERVWIALKVLLPRELSQKLIMDNKLSTPHPQPRIIPSILSVSFPMLSSTSQVPCPLNFSRLSQQCYWHFTNYWHVFDVLSFDFGTI